VLDLRFVPDDTRVGFFSFFLFLSVHHLFLYSLTLLCFCFLLLVCFLLFSCLSIALTLLLPFFLSFLLSFQFPREPKEVARDIPSNYRTPSWYTQVLQHTKTKLTWDSEDPKRQDAIKGAFREDLNEMDLQAYLASDSSDNEEEDIEEEDIEEGDLHFRFLFLFFLLCFLFFFFFVL
jgi:Ca2+/Na+ antiporter